MTKLNITILQTKTAKELCKIIDKMLKIILQRKDRSSSVVEAIAEAKFALRMLEDAKSWAQHGKKGGVKG